MSRLSQDRIAAAFVVTAAAVLVELLRRATAVGPIGPSPRE